MKDETKSAILFWADFIIVAAILTTAGVLGGKKAVAVADALLIIIIPLAIAIIYGALEQNGYVKELKDTWFNAWWYCSCIIIPIILLLFTLFLGQYIF